MLLRIDPASAAPLFEQLAASVRTELVRGGIRVGDRLPSAKEVAAALDVNLHTVLRAYQSLRDEGVIDLRRGRGAVVTDRAAGYADLHREIPRLVEQAKALGIGPAALAAMIKEVY